MKKPLLLDCFCGAGGTSVGYANAGFDVVGVDILPQPHYPYTFYQEDALVVLDTLLSCGVWHGYRLCDFAVIHASPPCQGYSRSLGIARIHGIKEHPLLIGDVRHRLEQSGLPWIIENVEGSDLPDAVELCGSMFGLPIRRHRWFSSSTLLFAPGPCRHTKGFYNPIGGNVAGYGTFTSGKTCLDGKGRTRKREGYYRFAVGQEAMGIDWMGMKELSQAIPPAYTEWVGLQLIPLCQEKKVKIGL